MLDCAKRYNSKIIYLSTSRVYSIEDINKFIKKKIIKKNLILIRK